MSTALTITHPLRNSTDNGSVGVADGWMVKSESFIGFVGSSRVLNRMQQEVRGENTAVPWENLGRLRTSRLAVSGLAVRI